VTGLAPNLARSDCLWALASETGLGAGRGHSSLRACLGLVKWFSACLGAWGIGPFRLRTKQVKEARGNSKSPRYKLEEVPVIRVCASRSWAAADAAAGRAMAATGAEGRDQPGRLNRDVTGRSWQPGAEPCDTLSH
jgi:hypothetical protein